MLLIYSHIQSTWTPDTGATWSANGAGLTSRDPADRAILSWPAATTAAGLVSEFGTAAQLGGFALLNTTLPTTATISVMGRRSTDASYTYPLAAAQTVASLPGGGTGVVLDFGAGVDPVVGARVIITFGAAPAAGTYQLGEVAIGPAVRPPASLEWSGSDTDPSDVKRTRGGAILRNALPGWREVTCTPAMTDASFAYLSGMTDDMDWQKLRRALRIDPYVYLSPYDGQVDDVRDTGVYGIVSKMPDSTHIACRYYNYGELTVSEIPGGE